jgi:murein DD-endopeptidase MepM/ murein hydrolase activator NlpD
MKYVALVFAGLLLAAALYLAMMSPAERARIVRVAPSPVEATDPVIDGQQPGSGSVPSAANAGAQPAATGTAATGATARTRVPPPEPGRAGRAATGMAVLPSGLLIPVRGVAPAQLSPTFEDARSEGRVHEALDIMAPAGTPVLAVADGHVEKLFDSRQGGLTIYQFEPSGRYAYYYAHLERYAPGVAEGRRVRRGEVIGYVGSTGNADPAAPHLHFAIFLLGPEKRWWEGTAIDPWPLLSGRR